MRAQFPATPTIGPKRPQRRASQKKQAPPPLDVSAKHSVCTPPPTAPHLRAQVQMILVNLPFPPLPVVGGRGPDGVHDIVSGHDLLAAAIGSSLVGPPLVDDASHGQRVQAFKMELLQALYTQMRQVDAGLGDNVEAFYALYCKAFRNYLSAYPGSPDLRFWNMEHIDGKHTVMKQGIEHLRAQCVVVGEDIKAPAITAATYRELIAAYAQSLLSNE